MNKRAVFSVIALVGLGVGAGFLWRKLERARVVEVAQTTVDPTVAARHEPAGATATTPQLTEKLLVSLDAAGNARQSASPAASSPADLQKRAELRKKLGEEHPDFATELQLTPEEAEQFLNLLARQQTEISAYIAAHPGSIRDGAYSDNASRDIRTMELADNSEQAAMLGEKFPQWMQYQQAQLLRNPLDQLQGVLIRQGINLSDAEIDPLVEAFAAEQRRLDRESSRASNPPASSVRQQLQEVENASTRRQLVKVASRYLSARQLEAFEQLLEQRSQAAQRLLRTMEDEAED